MNQPVIDAASIRPPLLPPAQSRWAWREMNIGSDLWYWEALLWKMIKSIFEVSDEWEWERKAKKGGTVIEFCKDKCWNASPYWMQLAVGSFWMRIIMKKNGRQTEVGRREAGYQRFASSVLWYHCVSNPACQHCIYSIYYILYSIYRLHRLFT